MNWNFEIFRSKKPGIILIVLVLLIFIFSGKNAPKPETQVASSFVTGVPTTIIITPTNPAPTGAGPSTIPSVSPTTLPNYKGTPVKVINVIDGDTIKIETGETVRYIGIDTPESVDPRKPVQCYAKEASAKNEELVLGKMVELEKDISDKDRYGRLLRYIWIGETLINEVLVREGFAYSYSYPPDIKYQSIFVETQRKAREEQKGLWGTVCNLQLTVPPSAKPKAQSTQTSVSNSGSFACDCNKSCTKMTSCADAQYQLITCGCTARDGDGDGVACDSDCQ